MLGISEVPVKVVTWVSDEQGPEHWEPGTTSNSQKWRRGGGYGWWKDPFRIQLKWLSEVKNV